MSPQLRSIAKRLLPNSLAQGLGKQVWEQLKRWRDRAAFRSSYPDVPYVFVPKAAIASLRSQGYFGQIVQDYFLSLLFQRKNGLFIDIGANNPELNSNSLYFEKQGWEGYAFDPMRSLAERWQSRPRTQFVNAGISDKVESRGFVEILPKVGWEHQLSAFEEFVRPEDLRAYDSTTYTVECAPISHFVPVDCQFDFASIDVEGAEALILAGFDFSRAPPLAILLENVSRLGGVDAHRKLLIGHGYQLVARLNASDDLFVHKCHEIPAAFEEAIGKFAV